VCVVGISQIALVVVIHSLCLLMHLLLAGDFASSYVKCYLNLVRVIYTILPKRACSTFPRQQRILTLQSASFCSLICLITQTTLDTQYAVLL
jgi:hypothetical protein